METYKVICKTDLYHAAQNPGFDRDGVKEIEAGLTYERAVKKLSDMADTMFISRSNVEYIHDEEAARQWLSEIEGDGQDDREKWLRGIIESGEYGWYDLDGDIIYKRGDDSFMDDIYYYSVEQEEQ